jgi:hypothetical protein
MMKNCLINNIKREYQIFGTKLLLKGNQDFILLIFNKD